MTLTPTSIFGLCLLCCAACSSPQTPRGEGDPALTTVTHESTEPPSQTATETDTDTPASSPETQPETSGHSSAPTRAEIEARVNESRQRLTATEAGQLVWDAIEAHGGLEPWFASGYLQFRFNYQPLGRPATDTYQTVDTWSSRAKQHLWSDKSVEFAWDGRRAWLSPPDAELPTNARFWALTPYYFVGIPFVLADPGVRLEKLEDAEFEGQQYQIVKATFAEGTGDAPEDYYVVYLHPETHRVEAIRYVVSYPGFYPDGGHGAEKLMSYDGSIEAAGLTFAKSHRTFKFDEETGEIGELVTNVEVSELEFSEDIPTSHFDAPDDARIFTDYK